MRYKSSFVEHRPILSDADKVLLHGLALQMPLAQLKNDAYRYGSAAEDFVWVNAIIEGCAYTRAEASALLRRGITAAHRFTDALILLNLRRAFEYAMQAHSTTRLDIDWLCTLHKIISHDLLPAVQQGCVRTTAVAIGASNYKPLSSAARLGAELQFIMPEATKYTDPFERAIYLHCNIAYLQYFIDGNKRTARLAQTAALAQRGIVPLFFIEGLARMYLEALIAYYETGAYDPYVEFFKKNYALAVQRLGGTAPALAGNDGIGSIGDIGSDDDEFERRLARLHELEHAGGAARTFWRLAQEAIGRSGSIHRVNWPDVERQTIIEAIAHHGHAPERVGEVICRHSPGAASEQAQQTVLDDIRRITPALQEQFALARGLQ